MPVVKRSVAQYPAIFRVCLHDVDCGSVLPGGLGPSVFILSFDRCMTKEARVTSMAHYTSLCSEPLR